jgi:predicted acylesterase/phospholipase RssA
MSGVAGFDAAVFAGGGCRCFWQLGFWEVAAPVVGLRPQMFGAVSAGAAMACTVLGDAIADVVDDFKARVGANGRNIYPLNFFRRHPIFPHERIYRDTILASLDATRLARLHAGPDIRVLVALAPRWLGLRSSYLVAIAAYQAEWVVPFGPHNACGRWAGFEPHVVSIRDCATPNDLADLILHSSCTPPLTRLSRRGARPVLDGGLIDAAPVETIPAGATRTLVLLTQHYPAAAIPQVPNRTYVGPSAPVPINTWDYTSPERVQATYDLGRRDGERFAAARRR